MYTHTHTHISASSVTVEENTQYVEFEIRRAFGTFGEVSVTMATTEGTAVAPSGMHSIAL